MAGYSGGVLVGFWWGFGGVLVGCDGIAAVPPTPFHALPPHYSLYSTRWKTYGGMANDVLQSKPERQSAAAAVIPSEGRCAQHCARILQETAGLAAQMQRQQRQALVSIYTKAR
jgi:hypothetical protein